MRVSVPSYVLYSPDTPLTGPWYGHESEFELIRTNIEPTNE